MRLVTGLNGQPVWRCDECGCNGVADDHVPGDEVCRLLRVERHEKLRG